MFILCLLLPFWIIHRVQPGNKPSKFSTNPCYIGAVMTPIALIVSYVILWVPGLIFKLTGIYLYEIPDILSDMDTSVSVILAPIVKVLLDVIFFFVWGMVMWFIIRAFIKGIARKQGLSEIFTPIFLRSQIRGSLATTLCFAFILIIILPLFVIALTIAGLELPSSKHDENNARFITLPPNIPAKLALDTISTHSFLGESSTLLIITAPDGKKHYHYDAICNPGGGATIKCFYLLPQKENDLGGVFITNQMSSVYVNLNTLDAKSFGSLSSNLTSLDTNDFTIQNLFGPCTRLTSTHTFSPEEVQKDPLYQTILNDLQYNKKVLMQRIKD